MHAHRGRKIQRESSIESLRGDIKLALEEKY